MKLSNLDKRTVENSILIFIGTRKVATERVIDDVVNRNSFANRNQVSGVISGMERRDMIYCSDGYCWIAN